MFYTATVKLINKKENAMKNMANAKTALAVMVAACTVLWAGSALAISGVCSNCHTMHNSQNGAVVNAAGPTAKLLADDCIGCHSSALDEAIATSGAVGAPVVLHTGGAPTNFPAGGSFYWVNTGPDHPKGHNVVEVGTVQDGTLALTPPGWDNGESAGPNTNQVNGGVLAWSTQLTCGGTNGCHGDHDTADSLASLKGAHHSNVALTTASNAVATNAAPGASYRFLQGIRGVEDADWEDTVAAGDHNIYFADDSGTNTQTISALCSQCHGNFHSNTAGGNETGAAGAWTRHPTDFDLGNAAGTEYAITAYSTEAPPGSEDLTTVRAVLDTTTAGQVMVTCISCHRAHGSAYNDLLRWDYSTMVAGGGASTSGCFGCHTTKDTP